jgi:hypothetical protein
MSGRGWLRLSPAWSGSADPVGFATAFRLTATVLPRRVATRYDKRACNYLAWVTLPPP